MLINNNNHNHNNNIIAMGIIKRRFFLNTTVAYYVESSMFHLIKGSLSFFLSHLNFALELLLILQITVIITI